MRFLLYNEGTESQSQEKLSWCLESIRRFNHDSSIDLITDIPRHEVGMACWELKDYQRRATELRSIYRHKSCNSAAFEVRCMARWMIFAEWLERHGGGKAYFTCDTDMLVFTDVTRFLSLGFAGPLYGCGVMSEPWMSGLSEFILDTYRTNDFSWCHAENVSDMAFCDNYTGRNAPANDLRSVGPTGTFDANICLPQELRMAAGSKELHWLNGRPFGIHATTGDPIRLHSLHCWGDWKNRMGELTLRSVQSIIPPP